MQNDNSNDNSKDKSKDKSNDSSMDNSIYSYKKITDRIWHIAEENGVHCTLIMGDEKAVLIDTGFGNKNLRAFVEANVKTPYIVINSHAHPDHISGNHWFEDIYADRRDWDGIAYFDTDTYGKYRMHELKEGQILNLCGIHLEVISLPGHTIGSLAFLFPEEKLLLTGDTINQEVWLFNYGSGTMSELYQSVKKAYELNFDWMLGSHSDELYPKKNLLTHMKHIEALDITQCKDRNVFGFETLYSTYEDENGKSELVFAKELL